MTAAHTALAFATHPGKVREKNEDAYVCLTPEQTDGFGHLLVVADGMGGAQAGELASYMLVNAFNTQYGTLRRSGASARTAIADIVTRANDAMVELCEARPDLRGMGTTCVVAAIENGRAIVAHVGDSRVYQATTSGLRRVTRDHSRVQRMVDAGLLTPEQAEGHPEANVITRALGKAGIEVDFGDSTELDMQDGPILLCSDGLHGPVKERAIELAMRHLQAPNAVEALIDITLQCGAPDNVTIILYQPQPPSDRYSRTQWYQEAANALERTIEWQGVLLKPVVSGQPGDSASPSTSRRSRTKSGDAADGHNDDSRSTTTRLFVWVGILACVLAIGLAVGLYTWNRSSVGSDGPPEDPHFPSTAPADGTGAPAETAGSGTTDETNREASSPPEEHTPPSDTNPAPGPPQSPEPSRTAPAPTNTVPPENINAAGNGSTAAPAGSDAPNNAVPADLPVQVVTPPNTELEGSSNPPNTELEGSTNPTNTALEGSTAPASATPTPVQAPSETTP